MAGPSLEERKQLLKFLGVSEEAEETRATWLRSPTFTTTERIVGDGFWAQKDDQGRWWASRTVSSAHTLSLPGWAAEVLRELQHETVGGDSRIAQ